MIRQGDVLLIPTRCIPTAATPEAREHGRVILAHGEVTGHAHELADPMAGELLAVEDVRYLRVDRDVALVHQEHSALTLAAGAYIVRRQREYTPEAIRTVAD